MAILYEFVQFVWKSTKNKHKHEGPPLTPIVSGAHADWMKTYEWDCTNSYELTTNFPKCKIVMNWHENMAHLSSVNCMIWGIIDVRYSHELLAWTVRGPVTHQSLILKIGALKYLKQAPLMIAIKTSEFSVSKQSDPAVCILPGQICSPLYRLALVFVCLKID